jgi:hypothetical protein
MPPDEDVEVTRLVRQAFEEDELGGQPANERTISCGSYASLALLMAGTGSNFVSAEHVGGCKTCQRMLARLLVRRCPSMKVLSEYRRPESDFAHIAALGWHIVGCQWCRLRLAFLPRSAPDSPWDSARASFRKYSLTAAYAAALLVLVSTAWLGFQLRRERNAAADRERQWAEERHLADNRIQALMQQVQDQRQVQSAAAQPPRESPKAAHRFAPPTITPLIATFTLAAGSIRGDSVPNEINIPTTAAQVRLKIHLTRIEYEQYRASFKNADGEQILVRDARPSKADQTLLIDLPARALPDGDFILTITGIDSSGVARDVVEDYPIRINAH